MQVLQCLFGRIEGCENVLFKAFVAIAVEAANASKAVRKTCTGELFPDAHDFFTRVEGVHERSRTAQVLERSSNAHKVVIDTGKFVHNHAEDLGTFRDFNTEHVFDCTAERNVVHDSRAVVQAVRVRDNLLPSAAFDHLFEPAVQVADFFDRCHDGFTIHSGQEAQATVSCRVARPNVQGHQIQLFAIRI